MGDAYMRALKILAVTAMAAAFALPFQAHAQSFPDKPVKVILPFPAGTGPDAVMRQVADKLTHWWGQPVTIDNKPGANGWTAVEAAKRSAPDGYTILQIDNLLFALQPHIFRKLPFDPIKDFEPVSPLYSTHYFVTVAADSSWNNLSDLSAAAKAKSGALTYGSSGVASHMHLGGAMLERATGTKMTHVPNKDTPQNFVSVANGEISWAFGTASTSGPMYRAGKIKYLALSAPQRHPNFPNVPTVAEALGLPNFELKSWVALFTPHGTPKPVVDRINADVTKALAEPDIRERMTAVGFTPWAASPAELARALADDSKLFGEIAKVENISLD
jgi:tripartite-type tricarboxylate transporter receptor subunit TctC